MLGVGAELTLEEGVACEYTAGLGLVKGVCDVVADGILGVAWSCQASVSNVSV